MTYSTDYAEALEEKLSAAHNERFTFAKLTFEVQPGRKFDRIVNCSTYVKSDGTPGQAKRHVHAFVERSTGDLIKAAGWAAPQKNSDGTLAARYNLSTPEEFELAVTSADVHGSYLYMR